MDLIRGINETTTQHEAEDVLFESNCTKAAENAEVDLIELTESVINWLDDIAQQAESGALSQPQSDSTAGMADHADKMRGTAEVIGAITALTDPDMAEAMNVKNPRAVLNIASSNHAQSDKAIDYLKGLGRGEAAGFTRKAVEILKSGDAQAVSNALRGLQNKAKKLLLIKTPQQQQQPAQKPGSLGLKGAMGGTDGGQPKI